MAILADASGYQAPALQCFRGVAFFPVCNIWKRTRFLHLSKSVSGCEMNIGIENGESSVEDAGWKMEDGGSRMEDGGSRNGR
jgi:hypothetical protein